MHDATRGLSLLGRWQRRFGILYRFASVPPCSVLLKARAIAVPTRDAMKDLAGGNLEKPLFFGGAAESSYVACTHK